MVTRAGYQKSFLTMEVEMLLLTRKSGEKIMIGDDIEIQVISIKGKQVRLGIAAPKRISINRAEIYERKLAEILKAG